MAGPAMGPRLASFAEDLLQFAAEALTGWFG